MRKKKKAKIIVNNNIKAFGQMDPKTNVVEINKKKHKGDKRQLADTIKHELLHVKHPKMTEKAVYKKTAPELSQAEQDKLIAKLRMKKLNYKMGAAKRKFKLQGKVAPGELINQLNAQKTPRNKGETKTSDFKQGVYGLI
jgi:hypothetical protein